MLKHEAKVETNTVGRISYELYRYRDEQRLAIMKSKERELEKTSGDQSPDSVAKTQT